MVCANLVWESHKNAYSPRISVGEYLWSANKPGDADSEECAVSRPSDNFMWSTEPCNTRFSFLCEIGNIYRITQ